MQNNHIMKVIVNVNDCVVSYCYHGNLEMKFIAFIYPLLQIELITSVFRNTITP